MAQPAKRSSVRLKPIARPSFANSNRPDDFLTPSTVHPPSIYGGKYGKKPIAVKAYYDEPVQSKKLVADKELHEKLHLKARREGFQRFDDSIDQPMAVLPSTTFYQPESERLARDKSAASAEQQRRQRQLSQRQSFYERKREQLLNSEEARWQMMEEAKQSELDRIRRMQARGTATKSNSNSVPFNPITLRYHEGSEGERLRYIDDVVKYRAELRKTNLAARNNGSYNPITGEVPSPRVMPVRPSTPPALSNSQRPKSLATAMSYS